MEEKEFYTFEEVKDELIGKIGTPERDRYEAKVAKALAAYRKEKRVAKKSRTD